MIPKFRAYHVESKIMAEVVELHLKNRTATLDIPTNKIYPNHDYWWRETEVPYSEIKIMQSTGMYDVNGVGIYEGDIVEYYHLDKMIAVVKMVDGCWVLDEKGLDTEF